MLVVNLGGWFQPEFYHRFASDQFRRVVPIAIDHHRHSTDTGQCAIGTGGQFGGGGSTVDLLFKHRDTPKQKFVI